MVVLKVGEEKVESKFEIACCCFKLDPVSRVKLKAECRRTRKEASAT